MNNQSDTVVNWLLEQFVTSHVLDEYRSNKSQINKRTVSLCTERPPTECDDIRCRIIQFWSPDDEFIALVETCRGV